MNRSFRAQLTVLFGLFALALAGALSYVLGGKLGAQALHERGASLGARAHNTALMFAEGLYERMREVELLATSEETARIGLRGERWSAELEVLQRSRPHYAWIGVTDASGIVVGATGGMLVGNDVSARDWYRGALAAPFAGDVHPAKLLAALLPAGGDGEPLRFLDFAAPVRGPDGKRLGTLGVHADWRWAHDVVEMLRSRDRRDAGTLVYVLDRAGRVLYQPRGADAAGAPRAAPTPTPTLQAWSDGSSYLTVGVPVPAHDPRTDFGWTVVVRQPAALALAGVAEAQHAVWLTGSAAAAAAMLLAWFLAGRISAPLVAIAGAAQRIERGHKDVAIPLSDQSSELAHLSRSLFGMTERLIAREHALSEVNDRLEARVSERTAELAQANARLEDMAYRDALTGLLNRRAADQLLERQLAQHRRHQHPLGVLLADIDHFKRINDTHGHAVGDSVLAAVAACIAAALRNSDTAARFGGEEFLIVLPETHADGVARVGEKLRSAVADLAIAPVGRVTLSFGGAIDDGADGGDAAGLLARADGALYAAKRSGRNRVRLDAGVAAEPA